MPHHPKRSAFFAASVALLGAGCFLETPEVSYATAAEAIADQAVAKGWIPNWLPTHATEIREVPNIDTSASELSFSIPNPGSLKLPGECRAVAYSETVKANIRRSWWPAESELRADYRFLRCPADAAEYAFVAIGGAGTRVLHWRTYAR